MPTKEKLIRTHQKKLVALTYLALIGRPAEEAAFSPAVDAISERGYNFYLDSVKSSEEFCLKYGGLSLLEPPVDLSGLTPQARRIYYRIKENLFTKSKN